MPLCKSLHIGVLSVYKPGFGSLCFRHLCCILQYYKICLKLMYLLMNICAPFCKSIDISTLNLCTILVPCFLCKCSLCLHHSSLTVTRMMLLFLLLVSIMPWYAKYMICVKVSCCCWPCRCSTREWISVLILAMNTMYVSIEIIIVKKRRQVNESIAIL